MTQPGPGHRQPGRPSHPNYQGFQDHHHKGGEQNHPSEWIAAWKGDIRSIGGTKTPTPQAAGHSLHHLQSTLTPESKKGSRNSNGIITSTHSLEQYYRN